MHALRLIIGLTLFFTGTSGVFASCFFGFGDCEDTAKIPYCNHDGDCSIDQGTAIVKGNINDIEKNRSASQYIQDTVSYLMTFVSIVAVLSIIYAGFLILTAGGKEDNVKKAKLLITQATIGIVIMFLAYSIVNLVVRIVAGDATAFRYRFIDRAYADSSASSFDSFADYSNRIQLLEPEIEREYKIDGKVSDRSLSELHDLVSGSMDTLPDDTDRAYNTDLVNGTLIAIEMVQKHPDSDSAITQMAKNLVNYISKIKIGKITGTTTATPQSGSAPLTVSLQALNMVDPSGMVIPKENFVWWIRTSNGGKTILGQEPSIVHTFTEERTYTVFLDVISKSRNSKGKAIVMPFQGKIDVQVLPKIGTLAFSVNGTNVSSLDRFKITPTVGRAGVIFDATMTQVTDGRQIVKTEWDFGNGQKNAYDGSPRIERQIYANEGTYKINLILTLNDSKQITKQLLLDVRDPVAFIGTDNPTSYVGKEVKFAAASSLGTPDAKYDWAVIDGTSGSPIYSSDHQNFTYKFPKAGKYNVRLQTTTPTGNKDFDSIVYSVESREPTALFDTKPESSETPNIYVFDATKSFDPDTLDSAGLSFSWTIDGTHITLDEPERNGGLGKYTFTTKGVHRVMLEVSNGAGKISSVKKDVTIRSLLWVKLAVSPKITRVGESVTFFASSSEAAVYEWNFGDSTTDITNAGRISHTYKKSGLYRVSVTVRGESGTESNSVSRIVYIVDADQPYSVIELKRGSEEIFSSSNEQCNSTDAHTIDRSKPITFNGNSSINVDGKTANLDYLWKYKDKTSSQASFSYKFDELGCFPISLTVHSKTTGATATSTAYVKVVNIPPRVSALTISADMTKDPVIVTVTADNAVDDDGGIASYLWYYYTDNDPEPQDYRITRTNKTTFVLPKVTGTYSFAVVMEDTNGAKVNTDDTKDEKYSLRIASDSINTPLIDLKVSSTAVLVGDPVTFHATTKTIIGTDISAKAEYKWDYDGDGFYDETTSTPTITHMYAKPGTYNMKVKATHKGVSNTRQQVMSVKNQLRPDFDSLVVGNKIILFNTSKGAYSSVKWEGGGGVSGTNPLFIVKALSDGDFPVKVSLTVSDGSASKSIQKAIPKDRVNSIRVTRNADKLIYFSIPKSDNDTITVDSPQTRVFFYLGESKGDLTKYVIDNDITVDTDLNGNASDDADNKDTDSYTTGAPYTLPDYTTSAYKKTMKLSIVDNNDRVIASKNITIVFAYNVNIVTASTGSGASETGSISPTDRVNLEKLRELVKTLDDKDRLSVMRMIMVMQENWFDGVDKTRSIIEIEQYVDALQIDDKQKESFFSILDGFMYADSEARDDVSLAINVIKGLVPVASTNRKDIVDTLDEIHSHSNDIPLNRDLGKKILTLIASDTTIPDTDKLTIKSQLQNIIYGGQANTPEVQSTTKNDVTDNTGSTSDGDILSSITGFIFGFGFYFFLLLGLFVIIFLGLYIFFRVTNHDGHLGFQDFLIDIFSGRIPGTPKPKSVPSAKNDTPPIATVVTETPKVPEASTLSAVTEISQTPKNSTTEEIPSWMRTVTTAENAEPFKTTEEPFAVTPTTPIPTTPPTASETQRDILSDVASESSTDEDIPEWLRTDSTATAPTSEISVPFDSTPEPAFTPVPTVTAEEIVPVAPTPTAVEIPVQDNTSSVSPLSFDSDEDMPAWLRGSDTQAAVSDEVAHELMTPPSPAPLPDPTPTPTTPIPSMTLSNADIDDLPDWLRSGASGTPMIEPEVSSAPPIPLDEPEPEVKEKKPRKSSTKKKVVDDGANSAS